MSLLCMRVIAYLLVCCMVCSYDRCESEFIWRSLYLCIIYDSAGTIFAYGQTGSGKTHSITGTPDDPGIIPRVRCNTTVKRKEEREREAIKREKRKEGGARN